MTSADLTTLLDQFIAAWEHEVVEFKVARNQSSGDKTGVYLSAIANEVNQGFTERLAYRIPAEDIAAWDDATLLTWARLTRSGGTTRAAMGCYGLPTNTWTRTQPCWILDNGDEK